MEQVNYDFLSTQLKFLGFGDSLLTDLNEMLGTEHPSFELLYRNVIDHEPVTAKLFFSRPDPEGYFFFQKYSMNLEEKQHTFFIYKGKGITVKEAYNLLSGRAVYKQRTARNEQKYSEWIALDLNRKEEYGFKINIYPESHGFDLYKAVDSLQITTPSPNWDRSMLIRSLEKGNLQAAFIREDGNNRKVHIQANPKDRDITIHDAAQIIQTNTDEMKSDVIPQETIMFDKSRTKKINKIA